MNKIISLGMFFLILAFSNDLHSQTKADAQRVTKVTAQAQLPSISADHNAAATPTASQKAATDLKTRLAKLKAEMNVLIKLNASNQNADRTRQIESLDLEIAKLEKLLGIN